MRSWGDPKEAEREGTQSGSGRSGQLETIGTGMKRTITRTGLLWVAVASLVASTAHAQTRSTEDLAAAETLFREGRALIEAGQTSAACRKFEESYRLDSAPGTLLNTARCHQLEGKIATAWAEFHQVAAEARRDGREDREKIATEAIQELEPRLPKLTIEVPSETRVEGLEITRNGSKLGRAAWGTATPVDPGTVIIEASAPGFKPWKHQIDIPEAGKAQVSVPSLEKAPEAPKPPPPAATAPVEPQRPPPDPGSPTEQTAGLVIGGLGIIGIGVGSYFGVQAIGKRSDSDDNCPTINGEEYCNADGVASNQDAQDAARFANLGIGLGVVALLAGTYLYFDGAPSGPTEQAARTKKRQPLDVGFTTRDGGGFATVHGEW